jgi:hypothetical protein
MSSEKTVRQYTRDLGYTYDGDAFRLPEEGETYLTPDGKIATKEKGDKGPYGPRLIVVEDLNESERTYGKGVKTGADALSRVKRVSGAANDFADGTDTDLETFSTQGWEVVELRKLRDDERNTYIEPELFREGFEIWVRSGSPLLKQPVYIVRKKQPRKKRVLVFDFEEVAETTITVVPTARVGVYQWVVFGGTHKGKLGLLAGVVEEREA